MRTDLSKRRVVITGLGIVSPVGLDLKSSWSNIVNGVSGISLIDEFNTDDFSVKIAATIKGFDGSVAIAPKDMKKMDLFIQYGMVAAEEALQDSGLQITEENTDRIGVAIGSGIGGLPMISTNHQKLLEGGPRKYHHFLFPVQS